MLEPTIGILGSYLFGLILFGFMFGYFSLAEGIQRWSDCSPPYRKWVRRGGHLGLMLVSLILVVYGFLTYVSFTLPFLIKKLGQTGGVLVFIVCLVIIVLPFLQFRKHLLREWKVKKLWQ
jgi:hypothetical protein